MMRPAGLLVLLCLPSTGLSAATISGEVRSAAGSVAGALVTARSSARAVSWTVPTRADGKFRIEGLDKGDYEVRARHADFNDASMPLALEGDASSLMFVLEPASDRLMQVPSHVFLELLPDGKEKRRLIIDCMGCHPVNQRTMFDKESRLLDEAGWKTATEKMLNFAGANSPFPIMAPDRDAASTAAFVAGHLTEAAVTAAAGEKRDFSAPTVEFTVTEYDFPNAMDFPHDLMLDTRGHVLVTGMFTGVIYRLDPSTAEFTNVQIPAPMANPRALDVDAEGNWWILCGMAEKVARYDIASEKWDLFDIGMYGHSIMIDAKRRAWFNGHFTNNPIQMGYVDGNGQVKTMEVPPTGMPESEGGPVPYGLRVGPDGTVWSTELAGNRLVKYVPDTGEMKTFTMPSPHSGPRRLDVAADGIVWIPEFAAGKLARFDPKEESFDEYDFPTSNSLPYCARVSPVSGHVWVSQCANDAIARFDPATEEMVEFRLPSRIAYIRHLDIDTETGDVWAAYSHSPGIHPRITRLRTN